MNRTNISGIINGGPIGGKNQNSKYKIDCRFNKEKLIKKIKKISSYNSRIKLTNLDANDFILREIPKYDEKSTFIFLIRHIINKEKICIYHLFMLMNMKGLLTI